MATATYPGDNSAIPAIESLPIPQNINVMVPTGTNTSNYAMTTCCAPSRVQIVDGCYLWCEVPRRYFNNSASHNDVTSSMLACIRAANRGKDTSGESVITGWQFNAGGKIGAGTVRQVGVWVLLVSALMYIL